MGSFEEVLRRDDSTNGLKIDHFPSLRTQAWPSQGLARLVRIRSNGLFSYQSNFVSLDLGEQGGVRNTELPGGLSYAPRSLQGLGKDSLLVRIQHLLERLAGSPADSIKTFLPSQAPADFEVEEDAVRSDLVRVAKD